MQTLIVIAIVVLAAAYLLFRLYSRLSKPAHTDCGCGCSGCSAQRECSASQKPSFDPPGPEKD